MWKMRVPGTSEFLLLLLSGSLPVQNTNKVGRVVILSQVTQAQKVFPGMYELFPQNLHYSLSQCTPSIPSYSAL